ncbi:hypothetical protein F4820DRAFT_245474 [Hypoxylon rubiginosum]|uniref:Uncharacterized protein n=1 Tax=Hypoxylon rubiginosum TaxID=110542 RepID=A0ACB9Z4X0_9PEZI|nr:hypothetical protein F4820DRAFT_245474 [Hypoxylon rubiginosum]
MQIGNVFVVLLVCCCLLCPAVEGNMFLGGRPEDGRFLCRTRFGQKLVQTRFSILTHFSCSAMESKTLGSINPRCYLKTLVFSAFWCVWQGVDS